MFNPFDLQNKTLERTDISLGAKVIMIRLRNSAGRKGKIQLRVSRLCEWVGVDKKQKRMIQYYLSELILVGLVKREPVRGHANYWIVTDVYGKFDTHAKDCTTVKESFQNKTNVCRNVIFSGDKKPTPPRNTQTDRNRFCKPPTNLPLLNDILSVTGDIKSKRYWIKVLRLLPEDEIRGYLSHLNIAMGEKIIRHPGAYLNSLVLANHPEMKRPESPTSQPAYQERYIEPEEPEGIPASEEVVKASLAEIKAKLFRKVG